MTTFRRMTIGTFFTFLTLWTILLTSLPQTRHKWLEFGLLTLFFAFLLMVLFTQNRLTTARKPKPPMEESVE